MNIGVVVATYGDLAVWGRLAERAIASADRQTIPVPVVWVHGDTLADARNDGVAAIGTDWVIICDADDELDAGYVEHMSAGSGDIRRPSTLGIYKNGTEDDYPVMIPVRDIRSSNYIVIGAMFRRDKFLEVGGFDRSLQALDDWDLWLRLIINGAVVEEIPRAVYRVGVDVSSERRNSDSEKHGQAYRTICGRYAGQL